MSENPSSSKSDFDYLSKNEEDNYFLDGVIDVKKIKEQTNFTLSETQNFITKSFLSKLFDRKNIIKYGKMIGETAVPIEQTKGDFLIQIINREQIRKRLSKLQPEERNKIAYIHISTIQIILKSTMKTGITAPIELEIRDDRLINKEESIIAKGKGNLGLGIIKFDINLQQGLSLTNENLDSSIIIKYELKRKKFMKENSKPFSVTYQINYALTNSHHSLAFKDKEAITIEDLFKPLIQLESPLKIIKSNYDYPRISVDGRSASMRLTDKKKEKEKEENQEIKNITILHQNDNTSEIKKLQELIVEIIKKL
ncbi:unnamed protein product [Linum tenue]|uniref:Movement protein n=1 Tax=Linum tenue TaxID=586396 RepID=A0AAV0GTN8_9ROSI|nr:unnamed protein product [Linum tenue]